LKNKCILVLEKRLLLDFSKAAFQLGD